MLGLLQRVDIETQRHEPVDDTEQLADQFAFLMIGQIAVFKKPEIIVEVDLDPQRRDEVIGPLAFEAGRPFRTQRLR
ncbi:MAG: hypothetical protein TEF_21930 [Rhizobiales bacterium NRL2]|nr:MAG: hypothetical protein TEF_21930 [Rhizobiales bacterium NRL2]